MLFLGRKESTPEMNLSHVSLHGGEPSAWAEDLYQPSAVLPETLVTPGRRTCANLQCTATWTAPWRNRRRPLFEDQWGCSGRCMLTLVLAAIRRESASASAYAAAGHHQHRLPLGLLLLEQGWITHPELQRALELQREQGGRIGELLIRECGVEPGIITRGLCMQWSCPVLGTHGFSPRTMALAAPRVLVERLGFLPLRVAGSRMLYVGFEDSLNASAALALEQMTELKVESGLMKTDEYQAARTSLLECEGIELKEESFSETDALAARITAVLEQKQPVASKLVRLHRFYWLRLWLEPGARGRHGMLPQSGEDVLDYVFTMGR